MIMLPLNEIWRLPILKLYSMPLTQLSSVKVTHKNNWEWHTIQYAFKETDLNLFFP